MRIVEALRSEKGRHTFEAAMIFVVLILIPILPLGKYGGGFAMLILSVLALFSHFFLYPQDWRRMGRLRPTVLAVVLGAVVAAALAVWFSRN